jgi:hypothetical protein
MAQNQKPFSTSHVKRSLIHKAMDTVPILRVRMRLLFIISKIQFKHHVKVREEKGVIYGPKANS